MASRSQKRRSRRREIETSHQRNWLTGHHAVTSMLTAGRWPFTRLCATDEAAEALIAEVTQQAADTAWVSQVERVTPERLTQLTGSRHHQGLAAQMGPFPWHAPIELPAIMADSRSRFPDLVPLVVVCDRIQDAHNLGAILRCCAAMAVGAVVMGSRDQIGITPQVVRSSAGCVHHLPLIRTDNLSDSVQQLRESGFRLIAAVPDAPQSIARVNPSGPTAVIIGNEAHGVCSDLLSLCDDRVTIPMPGASESLNAAVAAGIILYELRRTSSRSPSIP